jgi:diguanylate cyclase (GGDEF)-like protein
MGMQVHLPTVFLIIVVTSWVMGLAVGVVVRGTNQKGLKLWSAAVLCHAVGYTFLMLRDFMPELLSIMVGNSMLALCMSLSLVAIRTFHGLPANWPSALWPAVLMPLGLLPFLDNLPARVIVASSIFVGQHVQLLYTMWRHRLQTQSRGQYLLALGMLITGSTLALRVVSVLSDTSSMATFWTPNIIQLATYFNCFIAVTINSMGYILMTEERAHETQRVLAMHDALTGIRNRRAILEDLDRQISLAQRSQLPLTLLMIDVDHFKTVNDTHGHQTGDRVLQHVAEVIRQRIRTQDLLGRLGGEEFMVVLPNTDMAGGHQVAESLRQAIAQAPVDHLHNAIQVRISVGVNGLHADHAPDAHTLISQADAALYRAKRKGRNRVELALLSA